MTNKKSKKPIGTVYDDVFRTLITDSNELSVSFLNEMFGLNIAKDSKLIRYQNEVYLADDSKRITDSNLSEEGKSVYYHVECESSEGDSSILIRLFEYDSAIALKRAKPEGDILRIRFPMTGVLYLRDSVKTPNRMKMLIESPDGTESMSIDVAIMKVTNYDLESIFEKKLYFLLPFYIFNYENILSKEVDEVADSEIIETFKHIKAKLESIPDSETIDSFNRRLVERMIAKAVRALARNHDAIVKGVDGIMGGKVLDYPEKRILNRGKEEGKNELADTIDKMREGVTAEELINSGVDEETVELAKRYA